MLFLTSVLDSVFVTVTGALDLQCHVSFVDKDSNEIVPGRKNTLITTAGDIEICPPASTNIQRNIRGITIRNEHANPTTFSIKHTDGSSPLTLWEGELQNKQTVLMSPDRTWHVYTASGQEDQGISLQDVNLEAEDKSFTYNASGQLTTISGIAKQIAITYTSSGNIQSIQKTYDGTVVTTTLSYNMEGNLDSVSIS